VDKRIRTLDIEIPKLERQVQLKAEKDLKAKRYLNPKKGFFIK